jgi:hypothetical protein
MNFLFSLRRIFGSAQYELAFKEPLSNLKITAQLSHRKNAL